MPPQSTPALVQVALFAADKRCPKCGQLKPLEGFGRDRRRADGRKLWCRDCQTARNRAYRAANPEHARERDRAREQRNPGDAHARQKRYREKMRATDQTRYKAWNHKRYLRHRSYQIAQAARWAKEHPGQMRASREMWKLRNPDAVLAIRHWRRACKLKAPGRWTATDIRLMYEAQRGRCAYCLVDLKGRYHRDHMSPITRPGGSNWPWNICLACGDCNRRKNTKTAGQFLALLLRERRAQTTV